MNFLGRLLSNVSSDKGDSNVTSSVGNDDELKVGISFLKKFGFITSIFSGFGCIIIAVPIFVTLFILGLFGGDGDRDSAYICHSVPSADSVCSTVVVNGSAPMDIDDYVAGVVQAEVGGFDNIEIKKALAVAARTYALNTAVSSNGTCDMGSAGQGSQAYSDSPNQEAIQAAQDTSGMILVDDSGKAVFSQYDAFAWYEENGGYFYVSQGGNEEEHQKIPSSWVRSKYNQATLDWYFKYKHGKGLSQVGGYYLASEKGYDFEKILNFYYSDEGYTLASTNGSANQVCSGNMQTLDHYTLYHEGLNKLTKPLTSSEISNLNAYLENEIKKAGHGSGAAVAAAGQGLVYWLEKNKTAYLGYYWGGGHGDTVIGGDSKWGTNVGIRYTSKGTPTGPEYGLDCSGFVSWATRMACNPGFGSDVSGGWVNKGKKLKSVRDTEPGDVITNAGHIMLVVKNNGDGTAIIAEETGSKGLIFSVRDDAYASSYSIRSMKDWYSKNCTDIQKGTGNSSGGSNSSGKGKILLIAGHSYSPYCDRFDNECRGTSKAGYAEESETRKLVQLLKNKLVSQGFKRSDIDIVNELLGENFGDTSTSKSLYGELVDNSSAFKNIDFSKYKYAMEIHFNASSDGDVSGVCTVCTNGNCGNSSSINSSIRSTVSRVLNSPNNGICNVSTKTFAHFSSLGVPFTYLETEYYDNKTAMQNYEKNKDKLATEIAKVIRNNYS